MSKYFSYLFETFLLKLNLKSKKSSANNDSQQYPFKNLGLMTDP